MDHVFSVTVTGRNPLAAGLAHRAYHAMGLPVNREPGLVKAVFITSPARWYLALLGQ